MAFIVKRLAIARTGGVTASFTKTLAIAQPFLRGHRFSSIASKSSPSIGDGLEVANLFSGETFCTVAETNDEEMNSILRNAVNAQKSWKQETLEKRISLCNTFVKEMDGMKDKIARDITYQMGKPLSQSLHEVSVCLSRAETMISLAHKALNDEIIPFDDPKLSDQFERKISYEPIGVVLCLAPWNYPLLCAINVVIPAILAGNSVLLKHSSRTPLCSDHFQEVFRKSGASKELLQAIHVSHDQIENLISNPLISYVSFTGSVPGGYQIQKAAAKRFIDVGLELGGKDPAYVCEDVDVKSAAASLVDGAMYNAGQSCCAVERVYVLEAVYDEFIACAKDEIESYVLGDPLSDQTTLGPLAQGSNVFLSGQVNDAVKHGATIVCGGRTPASQPNGKGIFFEPTLLVDCNHSMDVMKEETFGPILPVMKVKNDKEAIEFMNDSDFGLTSSVWTKSVERGYSLCSQLDSGTVFLNRCDVLDPILPWSGRKDSGKGCSLSHLGFRPFTRTKAYNFKIN